MGEGKGGRGGIWDGMGLGTETHVPSRSGARVRNQVECPTPPVPHLHIERSRLLRLVLMWRRLLLLLLLLLLRGGRLLLVGALVWGHEGGVQREDGTHGARVLPRCLEGNEVGGEDCTGACDLACGPPSTCVCGNQRMGEYVRMQRVIHTGSTL
jgi:hypothetical protein